MKTLNELLDDVEKVDRDIDNLIMKKRQIMDGIVDILNESEVKRRVFCLEGIDGCKFVVREDIEDPTWIDISLITKPSIKSNNWTNMEFKKRFEMDDQLVDSISSILEDVVEKRLDHMIWVYIGD